MKSMRRKHNEIYIALLAELTLQRGVRSAQGFLLGRCGVDVVERRSICKTGMTSIIEGASSLVRSGVAEEPICECHT